MLKRPAHILDALNALNGIHRSARSAGYFEAEFDSDGVITITAHGPARRFGDVTLTGPMSVTWGLDEGEGETEGKGEG